MRFYGIAKSYAKKENKNEVIQRLKHKNDSLTKALEFAITLLPRENLPNGIQESHVFGWLINQSREGTFHCQIGSALEELQARRKAEKEQGDREHKEEQKNPAEAKQEREKAILPIPCTVGFDDWTVKKWFQKINEELDELKEAVNLELGTNVHNARHQVPVLDVAEEAADTITAITSMLEAMGIDEGMRQEAQRRVNERNRQRGRIRYDK